MAEFRVDRWTFPSKKALLKRLQERLHQDPPGTTIEGEDGELLKALVKGHPWATELIGVGVRDIVVGRDSFGGSNYQVVRIDGSQEVFSYRKTITKYDPVKEHRQRVRRAFVSAVTEQTQAVKTAAEGGTCPVSGLRLDREVIDVAHEGPGVTSLMQDFLASEGSDWANVAVRENDAGDMVFLVDEGLADRWRQWHRTHAQLRALHRDARRAKGGAKIKPLNQTYLKGSIKLGGIGNDDLSWLDGID